MLEKAHFTICFPHQPLLHIVCQVFKLFSHPSFTTSHQINLQVSGQMEHMSTPDWRSEPRPGAQKEKPSPALEAGALQRQKNGQIITTNGFNSKRKRQKKPHFLLSSEILLEQQKRNPPRVCILPFSQGVHCVKPSFLTHIPRHCSGLSSVTTALPAAFGNAVHKQQHLRERKKHYSLLSTLQRKMSTCQTNKSNPFSPGKLSTKTCIGASYNLEV